MCLQSFDTLSMDVCSTRHWQTSGQLVHEINVCTVPYFNQFPYLSFISLCSLCYFISHLYTLCVTRHLTVYPSISLISNYKTKINVYFFNCKTLLVLFLLSQTTILHSNCLSTAYPQGRQTLIIP